MPTTAGLIRAGREACPHERLQELRHSREPGAAGRRGGDRHAVQRTGQAVQSFINPLLSHPGVRPDFGSLAFKVGRATFTYGAFLTDVLSFLIAALVVYYVMVLPVSRLIQLLERNHAAIQRDCPECTMSIPVAARRCPECTAEITPATEQPRQMASGR